MSDKIELSKEDNDQLEMRKSIIISKQNELRRIGLEAQLFTNEYQAYTKELYTKYNLDMTRQYTIKDGFFSVVEEQVDKQAEQEE